MDGEKVAWHPRELQRVPRLSNVLHEAFARAYVGEARGCNAEAYRLAYGDFRRDGETDNAKQHGYELLQREDIKARIEQLQQDASVLCDQDQNFLVRRLIEEAENAETSTERRCAIKELAIITGQYKRELTVKHDGADGFLQFAKEAWDRALLTGKPPMPEKIPFPSPESPDDGL